MSPTAGTDDRVPVHDEPLAGPLLPDTAEERRESPFEGAVKKKIRAADRDAVFGFHLQGESRLVARGDLLPAGESAPLKARHLEVIVALLEHDKLLTVRLDSVVPVHLHILIISDIVSHFSFPPQLFFFSRPASISSTICGQYLISHPVTNLSG